MAPTPHLQVENLDKRFGDLVLFDGLSFGVNQGDRIGLIAQNGTGKSTLLNILTDKEGYESGIITFRNDLTVGYLEQDPKYKSGTTVLEACLHGKSDEFELKAKQMLTKLKIDDLDQKVETLSGGQLKRVALASALISESDMLILDEPTNHLDLEMTEWLEGYLQRQTKSLLMVTHDRYFLDRVCNSILEIDNRQAYAYQGNYSYYLEKRQERINTRSVGIDRATNLYRTELEWMRRMPQARGHKAKYREDAFYELEKVAKQKMDNRQVTLDVKSTYIGKKIFEAKHLCKNFGDKVILKDFSYIFSRYEKMGIVGHNGTGKSTFIKMLLGKVPLDSGEVDLGETVRFGYYSQDGLQFDDKKKVIDVVQDIAEVINLADGRAMTASQMLQYFLFTPETQYSFVSRLSGGERRRLYLCTILMTNPNFLVLDEPTNDLDIVTLNILEEYLQGFQGCVIVVSHDRYFMDKVVDHLMVFNGEGEIKDFPGNYTQYRNWKGLQEKENKAESKKIKNNSLDDSVSSSDASTTDIPKGALVTKSGRVRINNSRKLSYKEKRELEALNKEIAELENEKKSIETKLSSGSLDVDELIEASKRLPIVSDLLDEKEMRWLELDEIEQGNG